MPALHGWVITPNMKDVRCQECRSQMEVGFILDHTHGRPKVTVWHPGEPERSFWRGLRVADDKLREINVYRCKKCGLLRAYA